jgi:hypothetical protein
MSMKDTIFWEVTPFRLVEVRRRFGRTSKNKPSMKAARVRRLFLASVVLVLTFDPDDGGYIFPRNILLCPIYTVSYPRGLVRAVRAVRT